MAGTDAPEVVHERQSGRFTVETAGGTAKLDYELADGVMTITHTFVPEAARGQGIAGRLAVAALQHARVAGLEVVPSCPYVRGFIARNPGYADLLA